MLSRSVIGVAFPLCISWLAGSMLFAVLGADVRAHSGPDLVSDVLGGELRRFTPRTITEPGVLRGELAQCRRTGRALVHEDLIEGVDSIATRIINHEGRVVASLSVVVRSGSVQHREVLPSVIMIGMSRMLGWRPGAKVALRT